MTWEGAHSSPLLYFPAFCFTMKMVEGVELSQVIPETFAKWQRDVLGVMYASCFLWLPAQIVNFYFMPVYLRVPYINTIGAVWVVWLSLNEARHSSPSLLCAHTHTHTHYECKAAVVHVHCVHDRWKIHLRAFPGRALRWSRAAAFLQGKSKAAEKGVTEA